MRIEIDTERKSIAVIDAVLLDELNDWLESHFIDGYDIIPLGYDATKLNNGMLTVGAPISPWYTTATAVFSDRDTCVKENIIK